jgi:hypothetical protein
VIDRDFQVDPLDGTGMTAINALFQSGLLDHRTALEMLKRGEVLGDDMDIDEVLASAEAEQLKSMEQELTRQEGQMELAAQYEQPANEKPKPLEG